MTQEQKSVYKKSRIDAIGNIFNLIPKENPSIGYGISFMDENKFSISASMYEGGLDQPARKKIAMDEAVSLVDHIVSILKEEYKKTMNETLNVDVQAEGADVEKISVNNRFKLTYKKLYSIKP